MKFCKDLLWLSRWVKMEEEEGSSDMKIEDLNLYPSHVRRNKKGF